VLPILQAVHGSPLAASCWASAALRSAAANAVSRILWLVAFCALLCDVSPPNFRPPVLGKAGLDTTVSELLLDGLLEELVDACYE
jgi:hypothetical protein